MLYGQRNHTSKSVKRVSLTGAAVLFGALILTPSPGSAEFVAAPRGPAEKPTIQEVKATIDTLNHEAEVAAESMNTIKVQMRDARSGLKTLTSNLDSQRDKVEALRSQVIGTSLADYQSGAGLTASTSFLVADDPEVFLTDLANSSVAQNQQADMLTQLTQEQRLLSVQEDQSADQLDAIGDDKADLADHQAVLDNKTQQAQDILDGLEAAELERLLALQETETDTSTVDPSRDAPRTNTSDIPASDRAQIAVETALAQVGDPYVYGAAGPDSFDCSGLTMYAWAAAGVSIPHSSGMQPSSGTPVSVSSLMPGDLVFYYSPISHVAMYIGNGQVVHAPHPGTSVEVVPIDLMPIAMAVHIG